MIYSMDKTSISLKNTPLAVNLITGLLGSGKTTLIRQLIQQKPDHERWGVLINEFGEIGLDGTLLAMQDLPVYQVNGGCICCTARLQLQKILQQILQDNTLDRLLIEPTGLGHPADIIDLLKSFNSSKASPDSRSLHLEHHFTLLDASRFNLTLWQKSATLRDLVSLADSVIINKTDLCDSTPDSLALDEQLEFFSQLTPPKHKIHPTEQGRVPLDWLTLTPQRSPFILLQQEQRALNPGTPQNFDSQLDGVEQSLVKNGEPSEISWVFNARTLFSRPQIKAFFADAPTELLRAKGLIRMGKNWQLLNWVHQQLTLEPIAWRQDSRLEMLLSKPIDPAQIEKKLISAIQVRDL